MWRRTHPDREDTILYATPYASLPFWRSPVLFLPFSMKLFSLLVFATSLTLTNRLHAQEQKASTRNRAEVETKWSGVLFAISRLERIQDNRLLVVVRVIATSKAAPSGTFLGTRPVIPPGTSQDDLATGLYNAKPFSLVSAVMTHEQTQQKYPVLPPVAPPGRKYFPSELANGLLPGQAETLTIQFAAPPAPPPIEGGKPAKQTVSFLLPSAKGPIINVPIPAPTVEP